MKTIVQLSKLAEEMKLKNLTPEISMDEVEITSQEINRPALQLAGYYEHFSHERVQIIGYVEYTYLMQKEEDERSVCFERFIPSGIPCVIFTTLTEPTENMLLIYLTLQMSQVLNGLMSSKEEHPLNISRIVK